LKIKKRKWKTGGNSYKIREYPKFVKKVEN